MKSVLSIAGSDSSGGAGIQADIKTVSAFHLFAQTAVTALTAQNTLGVFGVVPVDPAFVEQQIDVVFDDIRPDAVKVGMVSSAAIASAIACALARNRADNVVVDPVMVATSGARLIDDDALEALVFQLIPRARVITPNIPEAEVLSGVTVRDEESQQEAARAIVDGGARAVLVKGGHGENDANDVLVQRDNPTVWFRSPRIATSNTHGTGCTLSSAIACGLASDLSLEAAIDQATAFNVISGFYRPTEGHVEFLGRSLTGLTPHAVCRAGLSRTFQNIRLFGNETVLQNVMVGSWVRQRSRWWMTLAPFLFTDALREDAEIRLRALDLLQRVGLLAHADDLASSLPYGAQRRLEIARALATRPRFLLLDEPAAGMNPQESEELMRFIRQLRDDFHLTILLIEHDMKVVMNVCDVIHVLDQGIHIAWGAPEEIRSNPKVIEAYLGAHTAGEEGAENA